MSPKHWTQLDVGGQMHVADVSIQIFFPSECWTADRKELWGAVGVCMRLFVHCMFICQPLYVRWV